MFDCIDERDNLAFHYGVAWAPRDSGKSFFIMFRRIRSHHVQPKEGPSWLTRIKAANGLWVFVVVFFLAALLLAASVCGCVSGCGKQNRAAVTAFIVLTALAGALALLMSIWCK
jgi:hypothetical protein